MSWCPVFYNCTKQLLHREEVGPEQHSELSSKGGMYCVDKYFLSKSTKILRD